ncbi:MAG: T9SS type A sorting domain-containing protein [Saprospiraceae bacterium]|nr:T9SS type A sorting domain-containing protein [Saprospiraceae bacterium]
MKNSILTILLLLPTIILLSQTHSVGHTTVTFNDPNRTGGFGSGAGSGRQIQTEIYYPATSNGTNTNPSSGTFPVIVFGHGFVMAWDAYQNIWETLVPLGYIMVFPRTEGGLSPSHEEYGKDLALCVTETQNLNTNSSSILYNHITNKSAIMGHSMGGGSTILAAKNNTTIETIIGLAPAETTPSAITAASQVTVPALILSGSSDGVTPPSSHHLPIYNSLSSNCKNYISITGGAHCYYANTNFYCDFGESTSSSGISITRTEQQLTMFNYITPWLNFKLKDDCASYNIFKTSLSVDSTINYQETCTQNLPSPTLSPTGSIELCEGTSIQINASSSLNWSNGSTGAQITINVPGYYFGVDNNCQNSDTINVILNTKDTTTQTITICEGEVYSIANNNYSMAGNYTDILTNSNNCDSIIFTQIIVDSIDNSTFNSSPATLTSSQQGASYQWLDCDNNYAIITGETNQSFSPNQNGNYAVEVIVNNCKDTSSCTSFAITTQNSIKQLANNINIYPNPSRGAFTVDLGRNLNCITWTIKDVLGKIVFYDYSPQEKRKNITFDGPSGVYILSINAPEDQVSLKIWKQ